MSAGSFKLNLVRSSGSKIKSREWKRNCVDAGAAKNQTVYVKNDLKLGAIVPGSYSCWRNSRSVDVYKARKSVIPGAG